MIVGGGRGSNGIDVKLAKKLGARHVGLELREFPDGEYKFRMPERIEGEKVLIVQSTYYPQDRHLFELLLITDLMWDMGAKEVGAVIPYLAFARQDKRFVDGESISIKTVMNLLNAVNISTLVTVQPHKKEPLKDFKGRVVVIEPFKALIDSVKKEAKNPFVLAPDKASRELARMVAEALGCGYDHIDKERDKNTGAVRIVHAPDVDLAGKDVIIADDMITSGSTMVPCSEFAHSKGARSVVAAAVHLLMVGNAEEKMKKAGIGKIVGTNTVPYKNATVVDITDLIADSLKK